MTRFEQAVQEGNKYALCALVAQGQRAYLDRWHERLGYRVPQAPSPKLTPPPECFLKGEPQHDPHPQL